MSDNHVGARDILNLNLDIWPSRYCSGECYRQNEYLTSLSKKKDAINDRRFHQWSILLSCTCRP
jgi:hypothetical protein